MAERIFEWLFVISLVATPATVVIGVLFVATRPWRRHRVDHAQRAVPA